MDPDDAKRLVEEIKSPLLLPLPESTRDVIEHYLISVKTSGQVTTLGHNSFFIQEGAGNYISDRFQYLSLRRVIDNWLVKQVRMTLKERVVDDIAELLGFFSSDAIVRGILSDENMVRMMHSCPERYSLLGKIEDIDTSSGKDRRNIIPLFIVPGQDAETYILGARYYPPRIL